MYIEVKIRYPKVQENGCEKKVNETYLVNAMSLTEAEAMVASAIGAYIHSDMSIVSAKKSNISEIFCDSQKENFFKVKVMFMSYDKDEKLAKKSASYMLVQADDIMEAVSHITNVFNTIENYDITQVVETAIMDVLS